MYARILVPIDGSRPSDCGVREAITLAKEQHAAIRFLHVLDLHASTVGYGGGLMPGNAVDVLRQRGAELLRRAHVMACGQGVQADTVIAEATEGRIADVVLREAARWPADLVVIGAHGCRGISELFLGSDAEAIARLSCAPVLLVRGPTDLSGLADGGPSAQ